MRATTRDRGGGVPPLRGVPPLGRDGRAGVVVPPALDKGLRERLHGLRADEGAREEGRRGGVRGEQRAAVQPRLAGPQERPRRRRAARQGYDSRTTPATLRPASVALSGTSPGGAPSTCSKTRRSAQHGHSEVLARVATRKPRVRVGERGAQHVQLGPLAPDVRGGGPVVDLGDPGRPRQPGEALGRRAPRLLPELAHQPPGAQVRPGSPSPAGLPDALRAVILCLRSARLCPSLSCGRSHPRRSSP